MRVEDVFAGSVMCSETNNVLEGGEIHEVLFMTQNKVWGDSKSKKDSD